ncbi:hypothetical protein MUO32_22105 [Shinella sp. CPCC 101442]|uniref:thermonuclease family protein n=1 Tax=Shinella sp. CPCC 101442 TaxID=2932265 RepID=UPI002153929E|nr:hypothetical protein [Shinella sp. CPCC 101442]MCR6501739.1 hypothetical protein [Shinella sp. CPCC 101442]
MTSHGKIKQTLVATLVCLAIGASALAAGLKSSGPLSDEPIWTDKPIRVDRKKQSLERVEIERKITPLILKPTARVKVFDSTSFEENGQLYVLTDGIAVAPRQLCRGHDQRLVACGQQARIYFRNLIANRTLTCLEDFRSGAVSFVRCAVAREDLAQTLVTKGAARAATPRLDSRQKTAMQQGAGIWLDAECRARGRCPPPKRRGQ